MKPSSTTGARIIMLALALLFASIPSAYVDAFRSSATATPPDVVPFDLPTKRTTLSQPDETSKTDSVNKINLETPTKSLQLQFKYDLGIGKNKPVINKRVYETSTTNASIDPTQFLVEHEAVSTYPSPMDSNSNHKTKSARKNLPKVNHRRHSEDVLHIRDSHSVRNVENDRSGDNFSHSVIVPIHSAAKLDVNTVWVEMMLHNERSKVIAQL